MPFLALAAPLMSVCQHLSFIGSLTVLRKIQLSPWGDLQVCMLHNYLVSSSIRSINDFMLHLAQRVKLSIWCNSSSAVMLSSPPGQRSRNKCYIFFIHHPAPASALLSPSRHRCCVELLCILQPVSFSYSDSLLLMSSFPGRQETAVRADNEGVYCDIPRSEWWQRQGEEEGNCRCALVSLFPKKKKAYLLWSWKQSNYFSFFTQISRYWSSSLFDNILQTAQAHTRTPTHSRLYFFYSVWCYFFKHIYSLKTNFSDFCIVTFLNTFTYVYAHFSSCSS